MNASGIQTITYLEKAIAEFTLAYKGLYKHALHVLWDESSDNLYSNMKSWYGHKAELKQRAQDICPLLDFKTFRQFLLLCLDGLSYECVRLSDEELQALSGLRLAFDGDCDSAQRLLQLLEDCPITQIWSAFTHFPLSSLPYFERYVEQSAVAWSRTEVRFEVPWLVHDSLTEKGDDPFVYVEITGTTHALGTFVVRSLWGSTWCGGYDDISTPTDAAMRQFWDFPGAVPAKGKPPVESNA